MTDYPVTPDGRYFVVKGRLWRCSNPALNEEDRDTFVPQLMSACRAVRSAMRMHDPQALKLARDAVNEAKIVLGERGLHGGRTAHRITTENRLTIHPTHPGTQAWLCGHETPKIRDRIRHYISLKKIFC
jgi:hypothetical protein